MICPVALLTGRVALAFPEPWLSKTGTVAHFSPEYSKRNNNELKHFTSIFE
jgi:hypothetical protein